MTIDWLNVSPWSALAGGALIGLSAGFFAACNGRIAGISGLLASLVEEGAEGRLEKGLFILGILLTPLLWSVFTELPSVTFESGWPALLLAGLLVGVGTRYGAGCTSGHGVCGLSRLSPRSLVATLTFMAAGFATVFVLRHVMGG
ncbi:YeeE/YedE family protein [Stutzerimonas stutzeri]|uniref:YeeE/YedE family protein n=1 Tax=Stutzerimonas stutzeri TaxID=316 RepID=UPI0015E288CD|nr:YeeE/YedE thiosulfate transporter family protein [Stutzerimonas stutzeri]MBA1263382.1 YeeE/YedE family protein [Stutzerimonas stutzeri]